MKRLWEKSGETNSSGGSILIFWLKSGIPKRWSWLRSKNRARIWILLLPRGLSYVQWLFKYREWLKPRIAKLGWYVDIDKLKLIVLAPDTKFNNAGLDMTVLEQVKRLNCEVAAAYIDQGWIKDETISITGINTF